MSVNGSINIIYFVVIGVGLFIRIFKKGRFSITAIVSRFLLKRNAKTQSQQPVSMVNPVYSDETKAKADTDTHLPETVTMRLKKNQQLPWTSGLSVNDWLLAKSLNVKPIRLVLGTAYYVNGFNESFYRNMYQSQEMQVIETAIYTSCMQALHRLQREAEMLGANAVVAVRLETPLAGLYSHDAECTFTGTAVKIGGLESLDAPLLCTVSMPELVKLLKAGSLPIGLSLGVGVYYQNNSIKNIFRGVSVKNQEMQEFTQSSYKSKHIALEQLRNETKRMRGNGVIKHDLHQYVLSVPRGGNNDGYAGFAVHTIIVGSVVSNAHEHDLPKFTLALNLSN